MVKKSKKFISKEEQNKFYVVHRSQSDAAYSGDQAPSDYVLVSANSASSSSTNSSQPLPRSVDSLFKTKKDHITSLGFKNDGYDYTKHLKEMGGGKFIGVGGGKAIDLPAVSSLSLPEEALPSAHQLTRDLNAITIDEDCMDEDLRAALFEDGDEDGEFEEIDDDFVMQVMQEPEKADFDFDAHIASLIAKSEDKVGDSAPARGWENNKLVKSNVGKNSDNFNAFEEDDEANDSDDSGFFDADAALADDDSEGGDDEAYATLRPRLKDLKGGEKVAMSDDYFEKMLDEYNDEEIGGLSDEEEEDMGGVIDVDNENFNNALEEFLQDDKDIKLVEGVTSSKGVGSIPNLSKYTGEEEVLAEVVDEEVIKREVNAQLELQDAAMEYLETYNKRKPVTSHLNGMAGTGENGSMHNRFKAMRDANLELSNGTRDVVDDYERGIADCQEYLRDTVEPEEWDCETIISTYSVLDNHPSIIAAEPNDKKKKKKRVRKNPDGSVYVSDTDSVASSAYTGYTQNSSYSNRSIGGYSNKGKIIRPERLIPTLEQLNITNSTPSQHIILGGKHNLPQSVDQLKSAGSKNLTVAEFADQCLTTDRKKKMAKMNRKQKIVGGLSIPESIVEEEEEDSDEGSDTNTHQNSESESEEEREWVERPKNVPNRRRNETKEEKKMRKMKAKELKNMRKEQKKQTKLVYKDEEKKVIFATGGGRQDINNISVFKYSH